MAKITDEDLLTALGRGQPPVKSASMLADTLAVSRQAIHQRLQRLHDDEQVERVEFGRDVGWYIAPGKQHIETGPFTADVCEGNGFEVRIEIDSNEGHQEEILVVQAGPNGYKLDLWWTEDDETRHANNWVRFSDGHDADYAHDNRHDRQPALNARGVELSIHDPAPRASDAGYEGAHIVVGRRDESVRARLQWVDEYGDKHERTALVPFADPRFDPDRYDSIIFPHS